MVTLTKEFRFKFYDFESALGKTLTQDITGAVRAKTLDDAVTIIIAETTDQINGRHQSLVVTWHANKFSTTQQIANYKRVDSDVGSGWQLVQSDKQENPREYRLSMTLTERLITSFENWIGLLTTRRRR